MTLQPDEIVAATAIVDRAIHRIRVALNHGRIAEGGAAARLHRAFTMAAVRRLDAALDQKSGAA